MSLCLAVAVNVVQTQPYVLRQLGFSEMHLSVKKVCLHFLKYLKCLVYCPGGGKCLKWLFSLLMTVRLTCSWTLFYVFWGMREECGRVFGRKMRKTSRVLLNSKIILSITGKPCPHLSAAVVQNWGPLFQAAVGGQLRAVCPGQTLLVSTPGVPEGAAGGHWAGRGHPAFVSVSSVAQWIHQETGTRLIQPADVGLIPGGLPSPGRATLLCAVGRLSTALLSSVAVGTC